MEGSEDLGLTVVDEEDNDVLLVHRISSNEIYRRQEDTIISWRDLELATELALSFQEATGCSYILDQISGAQKSLEFSSLGDVEIGPRAPMEALKASAAMKSNGPFHAVSSELGDLPSVELSSLPLILKTILDCGITDQIHTAELILHDQEFFPKLIELFKMCEDLDNMDGLHMIFRLVKGIILLNSPQIFDKILGEEFIWDIIGILEYDPDVYPVQHHRAFLKDHVVFKEAIPIKDSSIMSRIHQTYRISYLKDVILPRTLDEATTTSLNSIIHANNTAVISLLKDDASFIQELFATMRSTLTSPESKRDLVLFLHEFCSLSKGLQLVQQMRLFRDLASQGIYEVITEVLQCEDKKLVSAGTDILILFLSLDPNLLRTFVAQQEGNSLLEILVKGIVKEFGEEMHCQYLEIIRILLDSYTSSGSQEDTIAEIFFEKHLDQLIDVIASSCPSGSNTLLAATSLHSRPEVLSNICELLCFCVIHHPYRIKCNFLMNNAIEKVLFLTQRKERFLVVATIRFMRTIVSQNDELLLHHIVKNNLLKPIIEVFIENGDRYNMLHSGVLELLEYVCKGNIKTLIIYVVETFWEQLSKFHLLWTIQALKIKYDQLQENPETKYASTFVDRRRRVEDRALEKEEEGYFNEGSDEEDLHAQKENVRETLANEIKAIGPSLRSESIGLVDYDDDDDDYNPPPRKPEESAEKKENTTFSKTKRKLSTTTTDRKNDKLETTKKQKLGIHVKDDNIQLNDDDISSSIGNSSADRVINDKSIPGSEPYSVR